MAQMPVMVWSLGPGTSGYESLSLRRSITTIEGHRDQGTDGHANPPCPQQLDVSCALGQEQSPKGPRMYIAFMYM